MRKHMTSSTMFESSWHMDHALAYEMFWKWDNQKDKKRTAKTTATTTNNANGYCVWHNTHALVISIIIAISIRLCAWSVSSFSMSLSFHSPYSYDRLLHNWTSSTSREFSIAQQQQYNTVDCSQITRHSVSFIPPYMDMSSCLHVCASCQFIFFFRSLSGNSSFQNMCNRL